MQLFFFFFFSSRRRHTRSLRDWSSDVCSSDLLGVRVGHVMGGARLGVRVQGMVTRHGHRGAPPRPLSSTIQQLDLPHRRLTQRVQARTSGIMRFPLSHDPGGSPCLPSYHPRSRRAWPRCATPTCSTTPTRSTTPKPPTCSPTWPPFPTHAGPPAAATR